MNLIDVIAKSAQEYDLSSTQVDLPDEIAATVRRMASAIDANDLVRKEFKPHITLKYGLHTTDPRPVHSVLAGESKVRVRLGRTEVFESSKDPTTPDYDVVYVKVYSPDLRRLNARVKRLLPHTETRPRYQPHITVAYVKKGRGHKYIGRSDLEGKELTFDSVKFCKPSGRKTEIPLQKDAQGYYQQISERYPWVSTAPAWMAAGGLGGAGVGRYLIAPILSRILGLDPQKAKRALTILGAAIGVTPGALLGMSRSKLKGSFMAPGGPPRDEYEAMNYARYALGNPTHGFEYRQRLTGETPDQPRVPRPTTFDVPVEKQSFQDPRVYSPELWNPTYPVSEAMDSVTRDPFMPLGFKVQARQLIAESGRQQGVGMTGEASAGALMAALPHVVRYAVPTVGGAWLAAKMLGAPSRVKNTAIGGAMVYSALKGFMEKDNIDMSWASRAAMSVNNIHKDLSRRSRINALAKRMATSPPRVPRLGIGAIRAGASEGTVRSDVKVEAPPRVLGKRASMEKELPDGYVLDEEFDDSGGKLWRRRLVRHNGAKVSFLTENPHDDGSVEVRGVYTHPEHRGKGLSRYLIAVSTNKNKGRQMKLAVKAFKDRPLDDSQLTKFYESAGFRRQPDGTMSKRAAGVRGGHIIPEFNRRIGTPPSDNNKVSDWYVRAILAALDRPFTDVSISVPMQEHQWTDAKRRAVKALESSNVVPE